MESCLKKLGLDADWTVLGDPERDARSRWSSRRKHCTRWDADACIFSNAGRPKRKFRCNCDAPAARPLWAFGPRSTGPYLRAPSRCPLQAGPFAGGLSAVPRVRPSPKPSRRQPPPRPPVTASASFARCRATAGCPRPAPQTAMPAAAQRSHLAAASAVAVSRPGKRRPAPAPPARAFPPRAARTRCPPRCPAAGTPADNRERALSPGACRMAGFDGVAAGG